MTTQIEINGVSLAVDDQGSGEPLLLLHGFPELAYSWRHQVPALVDAGYRVISYDARGYGASGKPPDVDAYSLSMLVGDVVGLLDQLGIKSCTVVGHDWGSIVMYSAVVAHPERFDRVVSLTVPYRGACWSFPPIPYIREHLADRFGYVLMFQEGDTAERHFAADPDAWLQRFYVGGANGRVFHTDAEFAVYRDAFVAGGITGPVSWYRNIDRNYAEWNEHLNAQIAQPTFVLASGSDPVLPTALLDGMDRWVPNLDVEVLEGTGHWTQQERPEDVNRAIIGWLSRNPVG